MGGGPNRAPRYLWNFMQIMNLRRIWAVAGSGRGAFIGGQHASTVCRFSAGAGYQHIGSKDRQNQDPDPHSFSPAEDECFLRRLDQGLDCGVAAGRQGGAPRHALTQPARNLDGRADKTGATWRA